MGEYFQYIKDGILISIILILVCLFIGVKFGKVTAEKGYELGLMDGEEKGRREGINDAIGCLNSCSLSTIGESVFYKDNCIEPCMIKHFYK